MSCLVAADELEILLEALAKLLAVDPHSVAAAAIWPQGPVRARDPAEGRRLGHLELEVLGLLGQPQSAACCRAARWSRPRGSRSPPPACRPGSG